MEQVHFAIQGKINQIAVASDTAKNNPDITSFIFLLYPLSITVFTPIKATSTIAHNLTKSNISLIIALL
ncbi:hypothetical protein [Wolbachia endosymbiont of Diaphorina citri]|uniref:hypothetical protein n=1 Tax=Wolbachia endosymbiont of Diaphorina citri TaxID=116598 RepID=UPI00223EFAF1|nr:hypothetical protein [Wolbachia endosymbiont of Diaphorina citri]